MYWGCGPTNLPECQQAYIDWVEAFVPRGREVAAAYYGSKGWVSHTQGNIWHYTAPGTMLKWGLYTMGSSWHCRHVWSQYEYTRDAEYLRNQGYPILKEAAEFWLENLIEKDGKLISAPTVSAEHAIQIEADGSIKKYSDHDSEPGNVDGKRIYTVPGFQDIEMIYDLFTNVIKASEALNTDKEFRNKVIAARGKLQPLKTGKYGQLQEWIYDYDNARDHHRHISHLYAVYPGEMISVNKTPELAEAAKVSLNMRDEGFIKPIWPWTGGNWSMAMRSACWARLHDGERAIKIYNTLQRQTGLENLMTCQPFNPLWYNVHTLTAIPPSNYPMQVDASMATPGIFAEMLLQSEDNTLYLLPALPAEWPEGEIKGLCAKGGYVINMSWEYGQLTKAEITVPKGAKVPIVFAKGKQLQQSDKRITVHK
jgi:alpha-L-fucosidase 2